MNDIYAEELLIRKGMKGNALDVIRMGHPILRQQAKEIADPTTPEVSQIIANMMATINKIGPDTVVGLAAPQVNIPLRLLLFQVPEQAANGSTKTLPYAVVINPTIEYLSEEKDLEWEGCVSTPGLVGEVPRYKHIKYSYQNLEGKEITQKADDFHARVFQHEIDHLDGILYIDRMIDIKHLSYNEEYQEFVLKQTKGTANN